MLIDAHVHLSTLDNNTSLKEVVSKLQRDMDLHGITHAIIIPDNQKGLDTIADLDTALKLIKNNSRFLLLGSPQIIQKGGSEVEYYKDLLSQNIIHGIKFFPGHDPYNLVDKRCIPYYKMLEELDYPLLVHTGDISADPKIKNPLYYNDPKYIIEVAKEFPNLKIIITHYYWPKLDYCYAITKNIPNIYFEIAALADDEVLAESGGLEKMKEILAKTIKDRPTQVLYGTDWPMCDSGKHIELIKSLKLSKEYEDLIFYKNTNRIYKLGL